MDVEEDEVEDEWDDDVDVEMDREAVSQFSSQTSSMKEKKVEKLKKIVKENDLLVTLHKAEHLPIADMFGTIDPYVTISIVEGDPKDPKFQGPTKGRGTLNTANSTYYVR